MYIYGSFYGSFSLSEKKQKKTTKQQNGCAIWMFLFLSFWWWWEGGVDLLIEKQKFVPILTKKDHFFPKKQNIILLMLLMWIFFSKENKNSKHGIPGDDLIKIKSLNEKWMNAKCRIEGEREREKQSYYCQLFACYGSINQSIDRWWCSSLSIIINLMHISFWKNNNNPKGEKNPKVGGKIPLTN